MTLLGAYTSACISIYIISTEAEEDEPVIQTYITPNTILTSQQTNSLPHIGNKVHCTKSINSNLATLQVRCDKAGSASEVLEVVSEALPAALEWGEVLMTMQFAPINPADVYTARTGGVYGDQQSSLPFVAGHDGVGIVTKVSGIHCYNVL